MSRRSEQPLIRATALVAILCVLALAGFTASPGWHAGLHDPETAIADHGAPVGDAGHVCAVTLFAGGVEALLVFCLMPPVWLSTRGSVARATDEVAVARPRYWLVPSHAPPAA